MYQFYLESSTKNGTFNTIFIFTVQLTSDSDIALNKQTAGGWALFCVWLISCNDSMSLAVRKRFGEEWLCNN